MLVLILICNTSSVLPHKPGFTLSQPLSVTSITVPGDKGTKETILKISSPLLPPQSKFCPFTPTTAKSPGNKVVCAFIEGGYPAINKQIPINIKRNKAIVIYSLNFRFFPRRKDGFTGYFQDKFCREYSQMYTRYHKNRGRGGEKAQIYKQMSGHILFVYYLNVNFLNSLRHFGVTKTKT